jgi:hypothetical protein
LKTDLVVWLPLTKVQKDIYKHILASKDENKDEGGEKSVWKEVI